jgi:hypothetical protein
MNKWIAFLICPMLITYALAFGIDLILGHSISMSVYSALMGLIYGVTVFAFVPYESAILATLWLIGSCGLKWARHLIRI